MKGTNNSNNDLADRLKKLEQEWSDLQKKITEEAPSDKAPPSSPTFEIGGRIHLDYWAFPESSPGIGFFENSDPSDADFGVDPEDRFLFRRVRLEAQGDALATMFWRLQVEFSTPDDPGLRDVYIGFRELPFDQELIIGNQKRPLSLDALNSSRYNIFLERPLIVDADDEDYRRLGILARGGTKDEQYIWQYGVFCLANIASSGSYIGDAYQLSANARLASSPWYDASCGGRNYFHWAVAGMLADPDGDADAADSNENEAMFRTRPEARTDSRWFDTGMIANASLYEILAWEAMLNVGPLQIVGEYMQTWVQRDGVGAMNSDLQFGGWYVYANYILTGEYIPYERSSGTIGRLKPRRNFGLIERCCGGSGTGWGAWGVGVRYSTVDLSDGNVLGGDGQAWTAAVNWYWTPYARLQFNLISGEVANHAPVGGYTSGHYTIVGTRAMVDF